MPDDDGKMSDAESAQVGRYLTEKGGGKAPPCPISNETSWGIAPHIVQFMRFQKNRLTIGGEVYPYVMVSCIGCGYTFLVSAVQAGIYPPSPPAPTQAATAEVAVAESGTPNG